MHALLNTDLALAFTVFCSEPLTPVSDCIDQVFFVTPDWKKNSQFAELVIVLFLTYLSLFLFDELCYNCLVPLHVLYYGYIVCQIISVMLPIMAMTYTRSYQSCCLLWLCYIPHHISHVAFYHLI